MARRIAGSFRRRRTWAALVLMIGAALAGCEGTEGTNFGFESQTTTNTDFHSPVFYPVGNFPISMAVDDYDGNGNLDVGIINHFESTPGAGGTISILVNNGAGIFSTLTTRSAGLAPGQVVFADFDGSPPLDLAFFTGGNTAVQLLLNGVTSPPLHPLGGTGLKLSALDLDGDGRSELIASVVSSVPLAASGVMVVLKNDGTGVLTRIDPDLAVASPTNPGTPGDFVTGHWNPGTGPDQDPFLDLAVLNVSNSVVALFLGRGDGNFDPALHLIAPTLDSIVPTLSGPFSIVTGHWNPGTGPGQDNFLDLAISSSGDPSVTVYLSQGNGLFLPGPNSPIRLPAITGEIQKMIPGLFTPSGQDLVVVRRQSNVVYLLDGDGTGRFHPITVPVSGDPFDIVQRDFNLDGFQDLAITERDQRVLTILLGNGLGQFHRTWIAFSSEVRLPTVAHLNGDCSPDLLLLQPNEDRMVALINSHSSPPPSPTCP